MRRDERKLSDELKKLFSKGRPGERSFVESKIKRWWSEQMGEAIVSRTSALSYREGELTIAVNSAPLRNQLLQSRDMIIYRINKYLGSDEVQSVKLR